MKERHKVETKINELLGIKKFKKAVFKLEKIIHRKDKGKNINYHVKDSRSKESVNSFKKFLYYNGIIHIKNLLIGIPSITIMALLNIKLIFLIPYAIFLLKDLYCVMLQRYNWIKINEFEEKLNNRQQKMIKKETEQLKIEKLNTKLDNVKIDKQQMIDNLIAIRSYIINNNNTNNQINDSIINIVEITRNNNVKKRKLVNQNNLNQR